MWPTNVMSQPFSLLTLLVTSLLVTSCGFKLRGDYSLPSGIEELHVLSATKNAPLQRTLTSQLKGFDIQIVTDITNKHIPTEQIDAQIFIQSENLERRLLSLFSTGQVAEYELVYTINYYIQFPNEEAIPIEFDVTREYQDDPDAVLAKSRELDLVYSEMRQQAADRIIRQLSSSYNVWLQTKGY
ncbi:LPS assembly lipoprotein LptE [Paraglaciecola aquimarina]|uniref:LPS-assembly lipoprotein LptE n=1 Tax=Paraglaciecola aquimarina TaxID=1235557 RepID=A0ABU3SZL8_9ALTE|nr:LPS assembly lipoprotein LptE [Paraglaciecola aquimarina]MDU0355459.1 LPS assembly lipoprotein LptE [Paraglaciecola aquimarina]